MRKKNVIPCLNKREKLSDKNSCCNCLLYKNNECDGALEINLFRQDNNGGYELYQPLQELINKIARYLPMISTNKVLEVLTEKYDLKIDRTLLFKYHQKGLLEKKQKICKGRAGGVKTYWNNNTPEIYKIIKYLMEKFEYKLEKIKTYFEFIDMKRPDELNSIIINKHFRTTRKENKIVINPNSELATIQFRELAVVASFRAIAGIISDYPEFNSFIKNEKIGKLQSEVRMDRDNIFVAFREPINKNVWFKEGSTEIRDLPQEPKQLILLDTWKRNQKGK